MKFPFGSQVFLSLLFLVVSCCNGCSRASASSSLGPPYTNIAAGMTKDDVISHLGEPDRIIQASEFGEDAIPDAKDYWYFPLPLTQDDFDSRYFIVIIGTDNSVLETLEFSN